MENYVLSCCSTADLTKEHFTRRDIHYVCFHFSLDGRQYTDDLGESISYADFYAAMERGADTKTSQVNVEEFIEHFEPFLKSGRDVLHLTLSAANEADAKALLARYEALARQISAEVQVTTVSRNVAELVELDVTLQFGCTAEKLIFEMRARSI